jgi:hypothetical protein
MLLKIVCVVLKVLITTYFSIMFKKSIYAFLIPHCEFIQKIWNRYAGKARGPIGTGVLWVEYQAEFKAPLEGKLTQ